MIDVSELSLSTLTGAFGLAGKEANATLVS
jgi:hypothetical protein